MECKILIISLYVGGSKEDYWTQQEDIIENKRFIFNISITIEKEDIKS